MKTFKYRIYPNKDTQIELNKWFGQSRFVWNYYLNKRTNTYKETKKSLKEVIQEIKFGEMFLGKVQK